MNTTKILILAGAAAVLLSAVLPVAGDGVGNWTLLKVGNIQALVAIFGGAIIAGGLALANRLRYTVWPALAIILGSFTAFTSFKGDMDGFNAGRAGATTEVHLQWPGWAVLAIGTLLILFASFRVLTEPDEPEDE